jgi:hypothetical protein
MYCNSADFSPEFIFTNHFMEKLKKRNISQEAVELAIELGERFYTKGAMFVVLTKSICKKYKLNEKLNGTALVIDAKNSVVLTVYRYFGKTLSYFRKGQKARRNKDKLKV